MPTFRAWLACMCVLALASACAPAARPATRPLIVTPTSTRSDPGEIRTRERAQPSTAPAAGAAQTGALAAPDLFVRCADPGSCPGAVGMLVVAAGPAAEAERCTATLIGADRVLTASHCLAPAARSASAPCAATWVVFPGTGDAPAETIACARVVAATTTIRDDGLQQEHAVLQLARASARTPLSIEPRPPDPGSIVTVVSVTPHPVYGSTHALTTRLCRAIDSTLAEQELGRDAAHVGWLASCPIARGNSGSPVLDYHGRIRAMVHGGTSLVSAFGVTSAVSE